MVRALYRALIFTFDMEVDAFEIVVNSGMDLGVRWGQVRWPVKSPTASRWRLSVEPPEEDEDGGFLLLLFLSNRYGVELARWAGSAALAHWPISPFFVIFPFLFLFTPSFDLI
jgi:hypothetical protein